MWGLYREFRPEDRRFESRDAKRRSLANYSFIYKKAYWSFWIHWDATWHNDITLYYNGITFSFGVPLFNFIFPTRWYRICEINRIHHWCSVGTEKSQPEGPPFQWETRLAEFPTERWTRGLGFFWSHWTPMIDSFSHILRPYGTVLCNICWWRHWDRCLQSMSRAVQINLKQRINSALNNERMVISSKWIYKNQLISHSNSSK